MKEEEGEEENNKLDILTKESGGATGGRKKEGRRREGEWREEGRERELFSVTIVFQTKSRHTVKGAAGACAWLAAAEEGARRQVPTEME